MGAEEQKLTGPNLKDGVRVDSLKPGEKLLGHVDNSPALLIRVGETFFAIGAVCSHYSANLNDGIITDGTIRCPWHHACFNIKTGEAKKAPALNAIPTWQVEIRDEMVFVRGIQTPEEPIRTKAKESFVIVGSGAAGHAAAEMLRRKGFAGALTILSEDREPPYDRPNLSKDYLAGGAPEEWMPLRSEDFYKSEQIELRLNTTVTNLDPREKKLTISNGETLHFDKCLLATGGAPIKPPIGGLDLPHVHFLRSFSDCKSLIADLNGKKKVVIVGAGFIGLEGAAALRARGLDVTVIAPHDLPLANVVGNDVGELLKSIHEKNGVRFRLKHSVEKIEAAEVVLKNGERESADLVLVATGITPNISLAVNAGIHCDNGILVNEFLETNAKDMFAAGDIARWPDRFSEKSIRVEHWVVAQRQGQIAAMNMLGLDEKYAEVPFFWSRQFDVRINYIGHATSSSKNEVHGNLKEKNFAVAFFDNEKIAAVLTCGRDKQNLLIEEAMQKQDQKRIKEIIGE